MARVLPATLEAHSVQPFHKKFISLMVYDLQVPRKKRIDLPLNPMQLRFVEEYLLDPSSQKKAAIRAGYSRHTASTISSQLMTDPRISKILEERQNAIVDKIGITKERIVHELALIALANSRNTITLDENGEPTIDLHALSMDNSAANEVSVSTVGSHGKKSKAVSVKTIKTADKIAALKLLGQHIGMFKEQVEVTGKLSLLDLINKSMELEAQPVPPLLENQPFVTLTESA